MANPFVDEIAQQLADATDLASDAVMALIETPSKPELGDYAFPCFALAQTLRQAPQAIAQELAAKLRTGDRIAEARPTGPYVNFFVRKTGFVAEVLAQG